MKLFRTFIGGSKSEELKIFNQFSNDDIDLIEYQRLFKIFSNDIIQVFNSRVLFIKILTHILFITSILTTLLFQENIVYILTLLSFICLFLGRSLEKKLYRIDLLNDFTINIIKSEINKMYNI